MRSTRRHQNNLRYFFFSIFLLILFNIVNHEDIVLHQMYSALKVVILILRYFLGKF